MSGHSKWSTIKRKKEANDNKRGAQFTKLIKNIMSAVRTDGADPDMNFKLRLAIDKAKAADMPKSNIENAIKNAEGANDGQRMEDITYEGYGPGGVAVMVEVTTDNRNRAASDVRHLFSKQGGNLGESGCVAWMFEERGSIFIEAPEAEQESIMMQAMELPIADVTAEEDGVQIFTPVEKLHEVQQGLVAAGLNCASVELVQNPKNLTPVSDEKTARQVLTLIELLEENEDVQNVYNNADISDEVAEALG